jgi:hypothetical protein
MATVAAPYGFRPVGTVSGAYAGKVRLFKLPASHATTIFYGDPVTLTSNGVVQGVAATNAGPVLGVFLGCTYTDPGTGQKTWNKFWRGGTAAADGYAYVCDDPDAIYAVQSSITVAQADQGLNAGLVAVSSGNTLTGMSTVALSGTATTTALPFRIVGFQSNVGQAIGDAKTDVLVMINAHLYRAAVVGV